MVAFLLKSFLFDGLKHMFFDFHKQIIEGPSLKKMSFDRRSIVSVWSNLFVGVRIANYSPINSCIIKCKRVTNKTALLEY